MSQMITNWTYSLTPKEQQDFYNEIVEYFTDEVVEEVSEKSDQLVDNDLYPV